MYYGNPSCCNQHAPELVWDSNYMMVQHMQGNNWHSTDDSTSNNNDATGDNGNPEYLNPSGQIGYCVGLDDDSIEFGSDSTLRPTIVTMSAWVKTNTASGAHFAFSMPYADAGWNDPWVAYALIISDGGPAGLINEDGTYRDIRGGTINAHTWYYFVVTYDGNNHRLYLNSMQVDSDSYTGSITYSGSPFLSAGVHSSHSPAQYWDGYVDELHVSNIARNASWISTEYNNQNDPASFSSFGPEESGP